MGSIDIPGFKKLEADTADGLKAQLQSADAQKALKDYQDKAAMTEKDYDFWVVAFHSENDETIYRKDADKAEISRMLNDPDGYCKVWREFQTTTKPKYWVVWPHSESKGWCERLTGNLY